MLVRWLVRGSLIAARHAGQRALVQDRIDALAGLHDSIGVGEVGGHQLDLAPIPAHFHAGVGGEDCRSPRTRSPARQQRVRKMRADKARHAGDEIRSQDL